MKHKIKTIYKKLLLLALVVTPSFILMGVNLQASSNDNIYSGRNLFNIDLLDKSYIGDGTYIVYDDMYVTTTYNAITGILVVNKKTTGMRNFLEGQALFDDTYIFSLSNVISGVNVYIVTTETALIEIDTFEEVNTGDMGSVDYWSINGAVGIYSFTISIELASIYDGERYTSLTMYTQHMSIINNQYYTLTLTYDLTNMTPTYHFGGVQTFPGTTPNILIMSLGISTNLPVYDLIDWNSPISWSLQIPFTSLNSPSQQYNMTNVGAIGYDDLMNPTNPVRLYYLDYSFFDYDFYKQQIVFKVSSDMIDYSVLGSYSSSKEAMALANFNDVFTYTLQQLAQHKITMTARYNMYGALLAEYERGKVDGYENGYDYGFFNGYKNGEGDGYLLGYDDGYDDAVRSGGTSGVVNFYQDFSKWFIPALIIIMITGIYLNFKRRND